MNKFEIKKGSLVVIPEGAHIINSSGAPNLIAWESKRINVSDILEDGNIFIDSFKKISLHNVSGFEINKKNLKWLEFTSDQNSTFRTITKNGIEVVLFFEGDTFYWGRTVDLRVPVKYIHEVQSLIYNDTGIMPIFDLESFYFRDSLIDGSSLVCLLKIKTAINLEWEAQPGIYQVKEHTRTDNIILSREFNFNVKIDDLTGAFFNENVLEECGFERVQERELFEFNNTGSLFVKDGVMVIGCDTSWNYIKPNPHSLLGYECISNIQFHDLQYYVQDTTHKPLIFKVDKVYDLLSETFKQRKKAP